MQLPIQKTKRAMGLGSRDIARSEKVRGSYQSREADSIIRPSAHGVRGGAAWLSSYIPDKAK
jgi:hypothetical protein